MHDMRIDWGDLPIYCVDDAGAQEIDDGISLERIPGSSDTFWVRVHIANPSAFIPLEHPVMRNALSLCRTLYLPERTYPILPSSLTRNYFSLASGRPTITFSAKMNLKGDILDTSITNGIARNVVYITAYKLRSILDPEGRHSPRSLRVGGEIPMQQPQRSLQDTLSKDEKETFRTLRKLMQGFREWTRQNGALERIRIFKPDMSVYGGNQAFKPYTMNETQQARRFLGDPIIQLTYQETNPHEVPDHSKEDLVSIVMNLAGWISAKWCAERNIPALYDGTWYHPEYPRLTSKNMHLYGGRERFKYGPPFGFLSSKPVPYVLLGLDAYLKSTSPLRRDIDLITHYQIEAALRFENKQGRQLDVASPSDAAVLPFSADALDTHISRSLWRRARIAQCENGTGRLWACQLLFRAFYFGECDLPEKFTCHLVVPCSQTSQTTVGSTEFREGYIAVISDLGVACQMNIPEGFPDVENLSIVKGRIVSIDLNRMLVMMEATDFVKHFELVRGH